MATFTPKDVVHAAKNAMHGTPGTSAPEEKPKRDRIAFVPTEHLEHKPFRDDRLEALKADLEKR